MSYYVRLRKYGEKGPKMGEFGPFTTQKLAIKQGNALLDAGVGKDILVVVEKKKAPVKPRTRLSFETQQKGHRPRKDKNLLRYRSGQRAVSFPTGPDASEALRRFKLMAPVTGWQAIEKRLKRIKKEMGAEGVLSLQTHDAHKAKAKKANPLPPTPKWAALFDSLKPGEIVVIDVTSYGFGGTGRRTMKVGRRSHSKKYNVTSLRLDPVTGKRPPIYAAIKLYKRGTRVSAAHGDMAMGLNSFARANGRKNPKRKNSSETWEIAAKVAEAAHAAMRGGGRWYLGYTRSVLSKQGDKLLRSGTVYISHETAKAPSKNYTHVMTLPRNLTVSQLKNKLASMTGRWPVLGPSGSLPSVKVLRRNPRPDGGVTIREKLAQGPVNIMALGGISKEFGYPYPSRGATIDKIRWVYDNSERKKIHGQQMDSTTASVIIQVYDALNPANQAKYGKMKAPEMAGLAWELASKKNPTDARRILPPHLRKHFRKDGSSVYAPKWKDVTPAGYGPDDWIQGVDREMEADHTEGAFTRQARARGYKNTMEFARKVMAGWRSGKKTVLNKKTRKRSKITTQLMQRANFAINAQSRRNPSKPRPRSRGTMLHKGRSRIQNPSSPDYALGKASGSAYQMFVAQRLPEYTAAGHTPVTAMKKVGADWRKLKRGRLK